VLVLVSVSVTGRHERLLRIARKCIGDEIQRVQRSVLDRVNSARLRIAEQRNEVADLGRSLADTDARVNRLQQRFQSLSEHLAELSSQREVDRYLERMMVRLMQYGRAMRLVVCSVDQPVNGDPQRRHRASSPQHGQCGQQCPVTY